MDQKLSQMLRLAQLKIPPLDTTASAHDVSDTKLRGLDSNQDTRLQRAVSYH